MFCLHNCTFFTYKHPVENVFSQFQCMNQKWKTEEEGGLEGGAPERGLSPGLLTMVVGEHQQLQPHQHPSQLVVAATVLPRSVGHKDQGPAGMRDGC